MEQDKFQDYQDHLKKLCTERSRDLDNQPLDFVEAVWFIFGKGEMLVDGKLVVYEWHTLWLLMSIISVMYPNFMWVLKKKRGIQGGFDYLPPWPVSCFNKEGKGWRPKKIYAPTTHRGFYSELPIVDTENDTVTKALCYIHISFFYFFYCEQCHIAEQQDNAGPNS